MSEKQVATLSITFSDDPGLGDKAGQNKITLQQTTKSLDVKGQLYARCFPSSGVDFVASVGTVTPAEARIQFMHEALEFSHSSRVGLTFAGATEVMITPLVLMKKTTDLYGNTIITTANEVRLRYDAQTNEVVAEELNSDREVPVYGGCVVDYQASYRILAYLPDVDAQWNGGYVFNIGTIFAYNNYDVASVDMELDLSSPPDWVEYARVTSPVVLDEQGTHEAPLGWPQTTQHENGKELDPDNSFTDERTHCIVKVNTMGALMYEDFNNGGDGYWAWFDPKFGYSTWDPKYEVKFSEPPGGAKADSPDDFKYDLIYTTWREVFLQVDKPALVARLERDYPGLTEGQKGGNYE